MQATHVGTYSLLLVLGTAAFAQDPVDLRITTTKGTTAWFRHETKQEQAIDMGGQQMDMVSTMTVAVELTVKDVDDKGQLVVQARIARVQGTMTLPMLGDIEYDSAVPAEDAGEGGDDGTGMPDLGGVGRAMGSLKDAALTATIAPNGKVVSLDGAEKAIDGARKVAGPMLTQMLGGQLNESVLERLISGAFGHRPDAPIAVLGSWQHADVPQGNRVRVRTKLDLTLAKVDADAFDIDVKGIVEKAESDPAKADAGDEDEGDEAREMMKNMKISNGTSVGSLRISRQDGLVLESKNVSKMDIEAPSPMGGDMAIAMTQTITAKRTTAEAAMPAKTEAKAEAKPGDGK
jgi:hypothetical protein